MIASLTALMNGARRAYTRPIVKVCFLASAWARQLGRYPSSRATWMARRRVASLRWQSVRRLRARLTVLCDRPAARATSFKVTRCGGVCRDVDFAMQLL